MITHCVCDMIAPVITINGEFISASNIDAKSMTSLEPAENEGETVPSAFLISRDTTRTDIILCAFRFIAQNRALFVSSREITVSLPIMINEFPVIRSRRNMQPIRNLDLRRINRRRSRDVDERADKGRRYGSSPFAGGGGSSGIRKYAAAERNKVYNLNIRTPERAATIVCARARRAIIDSNEAFQAS